MRTRIQRLCRLGLVSLALGAAAIIAPRDARAEADLFGLGNGHSGAYTAAAANEVINAYAPLTADAASGAASATLTFGTPIGTGTFTAGDLVMLWRPTGITAAEAPTANPARIDLAAVSGGRVGTFELARVQTATATTIVTTKPLVSAWVKDLTQVIRVPEYTTVSVPAATSMAAAPWQTAGTGFAGGILVFLANGVVTINGAVHADARGFRGGEKDQVGGTILNCPDDDNTEANGYAAKGEGVAPTEFGGATHGGRGNRANGAGGGNCLENGGGGGGGFGAGGAGGTAAIGGKPGLGGVGLDYSLLSRLTMGGGGGAGEQKNGVGSGGGIGGGTVFIRARQIAGTGIISANGQPAANAGLLALESDGAGGGGAGGSVLLRAVTTVACGSVQTKGGKGGDTDVLATVGLFGAGGGGGGGRVLIQAKDSSACVANVDPGPGGVSGRAGAVASAGIVGLPEPLPAPGGNYCFSNDATDPQCAPASPVCDPTTGFCNKCTGPFGGGSAHACALALDPVCAAAGTCGPCDGDFGTGSTSACQLTGAPYCNLTGATAGSCGTCTGDADCAGAGHAGTLCNVASGTCGKACANDSECKAVEWCAGTPGVCIPKTPNGDHVPAQPPIDGNCTMQNGKRVCLSAVCEMADNLCGLKNGSPCEGMSAECRSNICFAGDSLCGKPSGEPCAVPGECRSDMCVGGVCSGCADDSNCGTGKVCDKDRAMCVAGCREVAGKSGCIAPKQCSKHDGTIGECVDGANADGGADGGTDGGLDDSGSIEGGGCACRTSMPISGSPLALAAAVIGALAVGARRRRDRHDRQKQGDTNPNTQERG